MQLSPPPSPPRLESLEEVDFHESGTFYARFATLHKLVSTTTIQRTDATENLDSYS